MAVKKMKVLVVGSDRANPDDHEALKVAGREIGAELASRGHSIVVGADDLHDIDPYVVEGALGKRATCPIEVHVPRGTEPPPYGQHERVRSEQVEVVYHQFENWDVTVMEMIDRVGAVVAVGGRAGVIQVGLAAWKMGTPVIAVGSFEGGGRRVWEYASSSRGSFYRGALEDAAIDKLSAPWSSKDSAKSVVDALEAVGRRIGIASTPKWLTATTLVATLAAIVGWVFSLTYPTTLDTPDYVLSLFGCIGLAGLLGGAMQSLRRLRDGHRLEGVRPVIDVVLGLAAGIVTAMLFLVGKLVTEGEIGFPTEEKDFLRLALIGSVASLFAALYLDSALARFDAVKESVLRGKYEG